MNFVRFGYNQTNIFSKSKTLTYFKPSMNDVREDEKCIDRTKWNTFKKKNRTKKL